MPHLRIGDQGAAVRRLQEQLMCLDYVHDPVDGLFSSALDGVVRAFQTHHALKVDGIVGPRTAKRLRIEVEEATRHVELERLADEIDSEPDVREGDALAPAPADGGPDEEDLQQRAALVLDAARAEWELDVREPRGSNWERIDEYIRGDQGLGWTWEDRYVRNRQFKWCGAFVAFCYASAGLHPTVRKRAMASAFRIHRRWIKGAANSIPHGDVRPGDILLVGPEQGRVWGAHITICRSLEQDGRAVGTFEGNAHGQGPDGTRHEGVVSQVRPFARLGLPPKAYRVKHVIRPGRGDYE